jgi:hypothetical protein
LQMDFCQLEIHHLPVIYYFTAPAGDYAAWGSRTSLRLSRA